MLVTFSSEASGDISFFGDVARQLLKAMGQSGVVPGALRADEVPEALKRLQAVIQKTGNASSGSQNDGEADEPEIKLSQRAVPLIAMLQAAVEAKDHVMWR